MGKEGKNGSICNSVNNKNKVTNKEYSIVKTVYLGMMKRERLRQSEKLNINWKRLWRSVFILLFCLKSADMKNECDRERK